jgi:protein-tyrosine sulfotransferase
MSHMQHPPLIIVGFPRSGTTLMRRLLDAHADVCCPGESFLLRSAARFLSSETVAEGMDYGPVGGLGALGFSEQEIKSRVRALVHSFYEDLARQANKNRYAIKTAIDSFYVEDVFDIYKDHARFVFMFRHGADVATSLCEFNVKMEGVIAELMPFVQQYRRTMPSCAAAWANVSERMLDIAEGNTNQVFALRYEDLLVEPSAVLAELFEFADLACDVEKLIADAFEPREVRGLGDYKAYATKGIDASRANSSVKLPERVRNEIAPIINPVLERAGYEKLAITPLDQGDMMRMHELAMMYQLSNREDN